MKRSELDNMRRFCSPVLADGLDRVIDWLAAAGQVEEDTIAPSGQIGAHMERQHYEVYDEESGEVLVCCGTKEDAESRLASFRIRAERGRMDCDPASLRVRLATPPGHTPGPWTWVRDNLGHLDLVRPNVGGGNNSEGVLSVGDYGDDQPQQADMTLIAAAPSLLAACEQMRALLDCQHGEELTLRKGRATLACEVLDNAIAQATGNT